MKRKVVIGLMGTILDAAKKRNRWDKWRPTVSIFQQEDLQVDRMELLCQEGYARSGRKIASDIQLLSPDTVVNQHLIEFKDPWDFEEVFATLHQFAKSYPFDLESEEYLIHITTGTHVAQICLFLLTESRYLPGKLLQTSPPPKDRQGDLGRAPVGRAPSGRASIIDLDLSRYDLIASRFQQEQLESLVFLKSGIATKNERFNQMIMEIETVGLRSKTPVLLMGPTGSGKSQLAKRIFDLKKLRRLVTGRFVGINCATLRGDGAMSTLFGHIRGSFTGALSDRLGLLREAHQGVLFLDEIGELGTDEQAMLLHALEEKRFRPVGSDIEVASDFQLIAGTNRDLWQDVRNGLFREDLLARINTWSFELLPLRERKEDIEPNIHYELEQYALVNGHNVSFNKEAYTDFLKFAMGPEGVWANNFRDLNAAISRMGTLAPGGRINQEVVKREKERLCHHWQGKKEESDLLSSFFSEEQMAGIDLFDRAQLAKVLDICRDCRSLSEAGRILFSASRKKKKSHNDSDRLGKYLDRFGLTAKEVLRI